MLSTIIDETRLPVFLMVLTRIAFFACSAVVYMLAVHLDSYVSSTIALYLIGFVLVTYIRILYLTCRQEWTPVALNMPTTGSWRSGLAHKWQILASKEEGDAPATFKTCLTSHFCTLCTEFISCYYGLQLIVQYEAIAAKSGCTTYSSCMINYSPLLFTGFIGLMAFGCCLTCMYANELEMMDLYERNKHAAISADYRLGEKLCLP